MIESTLLEVKTRIEIDANLEAADWAIQDKERLNLFEKLGVAVREMDTDTGPVDYMLFVDGKACGNMEAKREGTSLNGVAEQPARFARSQIKFIERWLPDEEAFSFLQADSAREEGYVEQITYLNFQKRYKEHKQEIPQLLNQENPGQTSPRGSLLLKRPGCWSDL